jgi:hypothetical protein
MRSPVVLKRTSLNLTFVCRPWIESLFSLVLLAGSGISGGGGGVGRRESNPEHDHDARAASGANFVNRRKERGGRQVLKYAQHKVVLIYYTYSIHMHTHIMCTEFRPGESVAH